MLNLILSKTKSFMMEEITPSLFNLRTDLSEDSFITKIESMGFARRVLPFLSTRQPGGVTNRWFNSDFQMITVYSNGLIGLSTDKY